MPLSPRHSSSRFRTRRLGLLAAALLTIGGGAAPAAHAASHASGSFGIMPAGLHVAARPGTSLQPTLVVNTTPFPYRVTIFPVLLTQELGGAFNFTTTPASLAAGGRVLSVSRSAFVLAPHHEVAVGMRWLSLPPGQPQATLGVVFQGVAERQNGPVLVVSRLLAVDYLRLPSDRRVAGRFTSLHVTQFARHVLRFLPIVRNTGPRAWSPADGMLTIRNATGAVVLRTRWAGGVVIPGASREYPVDVSRALPAGTYTATASMVFGARRTITRTFRLSGVDQLPTPAVSLRYLNGAGSVGGRALVAMKVASVGTARASVALTLNVDGTQGQALSHAFSESRRLHLVDLRPGTVRRLALTFGRPLLAGAYQISATWTDPTGTPHTVQATFVAAQAQGALHQFWAWLTGHLTPILAVVALCGLIAWVVRRQRRLEGELARLRAAGHAPPSSGR